MSELNLFHLTIKFKAERAWLIAIHPFCHYNWRKTDMIRGVYFLRPVMDNALFQILKGINIKEYCWHNIASQDEVYEIDYKDDFFKENYYDGESFFQCIQEDHYVDFVKMQAYFEGGEFFDIHTFEEFKESECQLLLLVYDEEYVEIFAKSQEVISRLYEQAVANHCTEIEYITDENDHRTRMDVR